MAIVNRTLDASEQRKVFQLSQGPVATGASGIVCEVPYPCVLEAGEIAAFGLSGAPTYALVLNRFIAGAGFTAITIAVGTSNVPSAFGTSGSFSMVLPASGSTLLNLLENDVLMYQTGVANTAVTAVAISLVLKPIQDIKTQFGA